MKTTEKLQKGTNLKSLVEVLFPNSNHTYKVVGFSQKNCIGDSWGTVLVKNTNKSAGYSSTMQVPKSEFYKTFTID